MSINRKQLQVWHIQSEILSCMENELEPHISRMNVLHIKLSKEKKKQAAEIYKSSHVSRMPV